MSVGGFVAALVFSGALMAGGAHPAQADPFRQLEEILPTPTVTRTGSGAPGHEYWQQDVDYRIDVSIDDNDHHCGAFNFIPLGHRAPSAIHCRIAAISRAESGDPPLGISAFPAEGKTRCIR